jgi:AcrR family transcriptional regulator
MINLELGTENKIVDAAYDIFLLRGYHGTTLQQIAVKAGVNKSSIHYYFRSKEKLYGIIVKLIVDLVLITDFDISTKSEGLKEPTWFLYTELYNNRRLFENTLRELQPDVWEKN